MSPYITAFHVHDVVAIELSAVRLLGGDDGCKPFAARDVSLIDKEGRRLTITAICTGAEGFEVRDLDFAEEPKCALPEPSATDRAYDERYPPIVAKEPDADRPQWEPPANPRPHAFPEHGGNCTRCGAIPHGPLSRLVCGKGFNNLNAKDRAVAAQVEVRS